MKQSVYSVNSGRVKNKSLFGTSPEKFMKDMNKSFTKSFYSPNQSLIDEQDSESKAKLRELICQNLKKIENQHRKNLGKQFSFLNKFKQKNNEKLKLEDYLFKVMDSVMVNLYLRISGWAKKDQFEFHGKFH
jgi:hypothetical protein